MTNMLAHRVMAPLSNKGESWPILVLLHGMGTNEEDLLPLQPYLAPDWGLVTVRAPYSVGPSQYQWYRLMELGKPDLESLAASLDHVVEFLSKLPLVVPQANLKQVVVGGFSQGGLVSAALLQRKLPLSLKGSVVLSGYLPQTVILDRPLQGHPVFWGHGEKDMVLSVDWGKHGVSRLTTLGAAVEFHTYPSMGHSVNDQELADLSDWLNRR